MAEPDTWAERTKLERRMAGEEDSAWPLVAMGALAMVVVGALGLEGGKTGVLPFAILVVVPAMLVGHGAAFLPSALFVLYNLAVLGKDMSKVSILRFAIIGITIGLVSGFTTSFYISIWSDVKAEHLHWLVLNATLALFTVGMYRRSLKRKTANSVVLATLVMFAWLFSYAFPWDGVI